jgi:hypothetical protein
MTNIFPLSYCGQSGQGQNGQNEFRIGHLLTIINIIFIYSGDFDTSENENDK